MDTDVDQLRSRLLHTNRIAVKKHDVRQAFLPLSNEICILCSCSDFYAVRRAP